MIAQSIKKNFKYILAATVILASAVFVFQKLQTKDTGIFEYNAAKDRHAILDIFKENMYWLVEDPMGQFSAEYVLDNKASSRNPEHRGNLNIYVYRLHKEPTGFVAFFKETFFKGRVLFLAVAEKFRKQGFARELLKFALNQLKNMGCSTAELITRVNNIPAQTLYKAVGFKEIGRDEAFIKFKIDL